MNDDGYTAADALAALAIVGLAVAGLMAGLRVVGSAQAGVSATLNAAVSERAAADELTRLVADQGPFRSDEADDFAGDRHAFSFTCGAARCRAEASAGRLVVQGPKGARVVTLSRAGDLGFRYVGSLGPVDAWPPASLPPPAPAWQVLRSVVLTDQTAARALATARVWTDQRADCEFDVVSRDCRRPAP